MYLLSRLKLACTWGARTNCVTVLILKFKGNVLEYRKVRIIVKYCDEYLQVFTSMNIYKFRINMFYLRYCVWLSL